MSVEKERMQLQKKILEIDRQMGLEVEKTKGRVPRLKPPTPFPIGLIVATAVLFGAWMFGPGFLPAMAQYKMWVFYAACFSAVVVVLRLAMWAMSKVNQRRTRNFVEGEESDKVRQLRRQRDELQRRLQELNK